MIRIPCSYASHVLIINDENVVTGKSTWDETYSDPILVPIGPVTRARAKKFKDALTGLIRASWSQAIAWRPIEGITSDNQPTKCAIQLIEETEWLRMQDRQLSLCFLFKIFPFWSSWRQESLIDWFQYLISFILENCKAFQPFRGLSFFVLSLLLQMGYFLFGVLSREIRDGKPYYIYVPYGILRGRSVYMKFWG